MRRPRANEFHSYYKSYIDLVESEDFLKTLQESTTTTLNLLNGLSDEQWNYRYAEGKWTVKEVLLHLIDAERIFAYRVLRIARGDQTPLAGFDQNEFIAAAKPESRSGQSIIKEYQTVRNATISLLENLDQAMLDQLGTASDSPASALAIAFIIVGHELHHGKVLRERYGL